jgi:hypothetical protein
LSHPGRRKVRATASQPLLQLPIISLIDPVLTPCVAESPADSQAKTTSKNCHQITTNCNDHGSRHKACSGL